MSDQDTATTGQVTTSAAETYEAFFVPALFEQWSGPMLDRAGLSTGDDVLDVGCGTGVLARAAAQRLGGSGSVTGVDINDGMLAVASNSAEPVSWRHGPAERLPFPDRSFDRVVSQFALMFFVDQRAGITEMARVTRPGGSVTIATWASVDQSPGYAAMIDLLHRLFGAEVAGALMAPFTLGSEDELREVIGETLPHARVVQHAGHARFDSLDAWIHTDVRGWTLADMISDDQHATLLEAARTELSDFVMDDGQVRFAAPALIASASTPPE
ncbi:MAG: methyltransferase domain-containing protein [Acidimicrobiia bacterium]|nr:methyltransferase domain-containing protein [Acidimicrobiia bacterium]